MKITQNFEPTTPLVQNVNNATNMQVTPDKVTSIQANTDEVSLSSLGKANQKIDALFDQADAIYQSHIPSNQQKVLNESYDQLDEIYSKNSPSEVEQKHADALFDKIDEIFLQAEKNLSPLEEEQLDAINMKIDEILGNEDQMDGELEQLFQQSDDLLSSKLTTKQKKSLDDLNQQLNTLFDKTNIDDEQVEKLFEKIASITNQGYENLSSNEKEKLAGIGTEIDELLSQFEQNEV